MRYQRRPLVVDVMRHDGTPATADRIRKWSDGVLLDHWVSADRPSGNGRTAFTVKTPQGEKRAEAGDYILKDGHGVFRVCTPYEFHAEYTAIVAPVLPLPPPGESLPSSQE